MVGDIFLQDALPQTDELAEVSRLLRSADIAFGNLETPVSERGTPVEKWINMRMPPNRLPDVIYMGFDVVTLANNHMMDFGEVAFFDTLRYMEESDLRYVGAGANLAAAWRAEVISIGDMKVAFLGAGIDLGPGFSRGGRGQARRRADSCVGVLQHRFCRQHGTARKRALRSYTRLDRRCRTRHRCH